MSCRDPRVGPLVSEDLPVCAGTRGASQAVNGAEASEGSVSVEISGAAVSNAAATGHAWPLSTENGAGATLESCILNSNLCLNSHLWL